MEDEDFGGEVVLGTTTEMNDRTKVDAIKTSNEGDADAVAEVVGSPIDGEEEDLYGGVGMNGSPTKANPGEEAKDDEEDEDDDDAVNIVINDSKTSQSSKPALRFTGVSNKYVRAGATGSPSISTSASTGAFRKGSQMADVLQDLVLPGQSRTLFDINIDDSEDKPWRKPGVDISNYFNYGFDEYTWRLYCAKQQHFRKENVMHKSGDRSMPLPTMHPMGMPPDMVDNTSQGGGVPVKDGEAGGLPPPHGGGFPPGFPPGGGWHPGMGPPPGGFPRGPPPPHHGWGGVPPPWADHDGRDGGDRRGGDGPHRERDHRDHRGGGGGYDRGGPRRDRGDGRESREREGGDRRSRDSERSTSKDRRSAREDGGGGRGRDRERDREGGDREREREREGDDRDSRKRPRTDDGRRY